MIPFDDEYNEMAGRTDDAFVEALQPLMEKHRKLAETGDYEGANRVWLFEIQPLVNKAHEIFQENMAWIESYYQNNPSSTNALPKGLLPRARNLMRRITCFLQGERMPMPPSN